jgi:predicted ATPase
MVYVLTGGPGFGKTMLAEKLAESGYRVGHETARTLMEEELKRGGEILPWRNSREFERRVMEERIRFLDKIPAGEIAFADRGLPDQAAFSYYKGRVVSDRLAQAIQCHRYATFVFITPPWLAIYRTDEVRRETFQEACRIHDCVVKAYRENGYRLVELPKMSVDERAQFVIDFVTNPLDL